MRAPVAQRELDARRHASDADDARALDLNAARAELRELTRIGIEAAAKK
jgi:hypothetical protein